MIFRNIKSRNVFQGLHLIKKETRVLYGCYLNNRHSLNQNIASGFHGRTIHVSGSRPSVGQLSETAKLLLSMQDGQNDKLVVSSMTQEKTAKQFCDYYSCLSKEDKGDFLIQFALEHEVDSSAVKSVAIKLVNNSESPSASKLHQEMKKKLTPPQNLVFTKIGQIEGGVKFLVDLRKDVIDTLKSLEHSSSKYAALKLLNTNLQSLLSYWFSMGFMKIEQVTWNSSCALLQKVSDYEAVHPVKNWTDLKTRVGSYRRCFVYKHPSMPEEPMVILHVALSESIAKSITSLVKDHRSVKGFPRDQAWSGFGNSSENPDLCKAAIFYSVTSTQTGLQGIELGTHLIKQAVVSLKKEFPSLDTFSTLSPIPGFRSWLLMELTNAVRGETDILSTTEVDLLQNALQSENVYQGFSELVRNSTWVGSDELEPILKPIMLRLCARYLYKEKRRNNALNAVANFHLRNGSCLWRINWLADPSPRGMSNSCGLMVNYRYFLDRLEDNSNNYLNNFSIDADVQVTKLLN